MSEKERCKEKVPGKGTWGYLHKTQCKRAAWKDGYCKQHHPDTVKERQDKASEEWAKKWGAESKKRRLEQSAPALLKALKAIVNSTDYGDDRPLMQQAKAAIAQAEGDE